ncbi:pumilio 23 [Artemisia annua]|uniref:Pumilio 23 n=1 Tax=Artemisia annua TaxID=35608 RepID=A0A2U1LX76_ARTAN|nr:pumilio 23 [Artemisia annua]
MSQHAYADLVPDMLFQPVATKSLDKILFGAGYAFPTSGNEVPRQDSVRREIQLALKVSNAHRLKLGLASRNLWLSSPHIALSIILAHEKSFQAENFLLIKSIFFSAQVVFRSDTGKCKKLRSEYDEFLKLVATPFDLLRKMANLNLQQVAEICNSYKPRNLQILWLISVVLGYELEVYVIIFYNAVMMWIQLNRVLKPLIPFIKPLLLQILWLISVVLGYELEVYVIIFIMLGAVRFIRLSFQEVTCCSRTTVKSEALSVGWEWIPRDADGIPDILKFLVAEILKAARKDIEILQFDQYGCKGNLIDSNAAKKLLGLMKEAAFSHLMEVILEVVPDTLYTELITKVFKGSLYEMSTHYCGNFIVQALISQARSEDHWGVVASLLAACQKLHSHEQKCRQALTGAVSVGIEPPRCIVPQILFLDNYYCKDKCNWDWPSGARMHTMGTLILQSVFKFPSIVRITFGVTLFYRDFIQCFYLEYDIIGRDHLPWDPKRTLDGGESVEAFLYLSDVWEQKRVELEGYFAELCVLQSCSITVEKCFDVSGLALREVIVSEMSTVQAELSKARQGPHLLRKLDIDGYAKRPDQGKLRQTSREFAYNDFISTFGSKETKAKYDASFTENCPKSHSKRSEAQGHEENRKMQLGCSFGRFYPVRDRSELALDFQDFVDGQVVHHDVTTNEVDSAEEIIKGLSVLHQKWCTIFNWQDGPLVQAMKNGDLFLVDEISLADDSVLERLNSVLELEMNMSLAEKGGSDLEKITTHEKFFILATMNPGGDFGKKELSPALRNRFTEIWSLTYVLSFRISNPEILFVADAMINFWKWFNGLQTGRKRTVRDLLSWIDFVNVTKKGISKFEAENLKEWCLSFLKEQLKVPCQWMHRPKILLSPLASYQIFLVLKFFRGILTSVEAWCRDNEIFSCEETAGCRFSDIEVVQMAELQSFGEFSRVLKPGVEIVIHQTSADAKETETAGCRFSDIEVVQMAELQSFGIKAKKPTWKFGSSFSLKKMVKSLPKVLIDDDMDLIDEDSLLSKPTPTCAQNSKSLSWMVVKKLFLETETSSYETPKHVYIDDCADPKCFPWLVDEKGAFTAKGGHDKDSKRDPIGIKNLNARRLKLGLASRNLWLSSPHIAECHRFFLLSARSLFQQIILAHKKSFQAENFLLINLYSFQLREIEQLSKYADAKTARSVMLAELKTLIEARLRTLINQSLNWQHQLCKNQKPNSDIRTRIVPKAQPGFPHLGAHGLFHAAPATLPPNLAGWMPNPPVHHSSASAGPIIGFGPLNDAFDHSFSDMAAMLKRGRTPTNNPALEFRTADWEHAFKRTRDFGISDEVNHLPVNVLPVGNSGQSHGKAHNRSKPSVKYPDENQVPVKGFKTNHVSSNLKPRSIWGSNIVKGFSADKKVKPQVTKKTQQQEVKIVNVANTKNPSVSNRAKRSLIGDLSCSTHVHPQGFNKSGSFSGSRDLFAELDQLRNLLQESKDREAKLIEFSTVSWKYNKGVEVDVLKLRRLNAELHLQKRNLCCRISSMETQLAALAKDSENEFGLVVNKRRWNEIEDAFFFCHAEAMNVSVPDSRECIEKVTDDFPTLITDLVNLAQQNGGNLSKRTDSRKDTLNDGTCDTLDVNNVRNNMIGEIENRSSHLLGIKEDVETQG